jgi:hypothetical protein
MDYNFQVKVISDDGVSPDDLAANVLAALREHVGRFAAISGEAIEVRGLSVLYVGSGEPAAPQAAADLPPGPDGLPQNAAAVCPVCEHPRVEHGAMKGAHGDDGCRHPGCNCILTHGF